MKKIVSFTLVLYLMTSCSEKKVHTKDDFVITDGQMPALAKDKSNNVHLVYGMGDSIMYVYSSDNGNTFSNPLLVSALPHVYTFATRGPQVAVTDKGLLITACTSQGNIFSFYKETGNDWTKGEKLNDVDTVAKEGLMGLSSYGNTAFAVWLDLRGNKRNKIVGAKSIDGGKTWLKNKIIYTSPDSTVCQCCKPSVVVWQNKVAVMFRNWLQGNRDLYLVQSTDAGGSFGAAQKLGTGSWKLDGCPMDGGNLAVNDNGAVQTVWRRGATVFSTNPGMPEKEMGQGKSCTIEIVNNKNVYAWTENGQVVVMKPDGEKKILGMGIQPVLKALDNAHLLCVWENNKQLHASVVEL
ncbi:MAG: sialidase family protein [Ferruginibacter sp.]